MKISHFVICFFKSRELTNVSAILFHVVASTTDANNPSLQVAQIGKFDVRIASTKCAASASLAVWGPAGAIGHHESGARHTWCLGSKKFIEIRRCRWEDRWEGIREREFAINILAILCRALFPLGS